MEKYFECIHASTLLVPIWLVAVLWFIAFFISALLAAQISQLTSGKSGIVVSGKAQPDLSAKKLALQLLVSCLVLLAANFLGGAAEAFLAGGWLLTAVTIAAMNLRNHLSLKRFAQSGTSSGKITFSAEYSLLELSYGLAANALLFLVIAILLAQPPAFGAAWFLGAHSIGFRRRARAAATA